MAGIMDFLGSSALGNIAGLGSLGVSLAGLFGGGDETKYPSEYLDLLKAQKTQADLANQYSQSYLPFSQQTMQNLGPLIQQRLTNPGLPTDLENRVWQLAQQRAGQGYSNLGNQLGISAAGRGVLNSGATMGNWMNQVGLAKAQGQEGMATERALANYQALNDAIQQAQSFMQGGQPQANFGGVPNLGQPGTDYGSLGSLFAQGLNMLGTQKNVQNVQGVGTQPGQSGQYGLLNQDVNSWWRS
jgi:hypothetical protein